MKRRNKQPAPIGASFRAIFERDRELLPARAVHLGELCLLHIENLTSDCEPFLKQLAVEAIDEFVAAANQQMHR